MKIIIFIVIAILVAVIVIPIIIVIKLIVEANQKKQRREDRKVEKESQKLSSKNWHIRSLCQKWNDMNGKIIGQELKDFEGYRSEGFIIVEVNGNKQIAKPAKL